MSSFHVVERARSLQDFSRQWQRQGLQVGFVPTMGALHAGHVSLFERAARENDRVIASIFVNPTQFNDKNDLQNYPRPLEHDMAQVKRAGVNALFLPSIEEMYGQPESPSSTRFSVHENRDSQLLCGPKRPGHFDGVLTVVLKLLQIAQPQRAYFGEKDYQQLRLIQDMAAAFFIPTEIVPCPTVREADGLAMSSRNQLLTPVERQQAPWIYKILESAKTAEEARVQLTAKGFRVDYVEEHWGRRFVAAYLGSVRLIDNVAL